ncbi:DUF1707 domain-containing protein [Actinospica durhamensis]|uniref:DUF1707 domain-containing protein n=1 Tax=Actinospica durhamensis TaxID=1508375 RepID=A0A941ITV7_9ACTN|nr:DUF1707 domain-containing protein [Actinospica durhamensis]MBR7838167.1 DUF1707 domain-containing protein [Actinospica durhamensis]
MAMDEQPAQRRAELDLRASDTDRERVAELLRTAAGHGRITLDELGERLEAVYSAKTYRELEPITADLPTEQGSAPRVSVPEDAVPLTGAPSPVRRAAIAVMSGAKRTGAWVVPKRLRAFAFWGGVVFDLRDARYESAFTEISAVAIMGGVQIIAPPQVRVEVVGIGFMGGFGENEPTAVPPANAPVVRVKGFAFWGGVAVQHEAQPQRREVGEGRDGRGELVR